MKAVLTLSILIVLAAASSGDQSPGFFTSNSVSHSVMMEGQIKILKWPNNNTTERRAWDSQGYNQWGGHDIWCISPMYAICNLWSWRTIYPASTPESSVPSETRCASYGLGLIEAAAQAQGYTLPTDFSVSYSEEGFSD